MTTRRFSIGSESDVTIAVLGAKAFAKESRFNELAQTSIATAVSELGHNIVKYAERGSIALRPVESGEIQGMEIVAKDSGPGIADLELALKDHYSSSGTLGLGLPGVQRMMDEFRIDSKPGEGTRVTARKWRR